MNELEARDAIQAVILATPPTDVDVGNIAWQGLNFKTPADDNWMRVQVDHQLSNQLSFGAPGESRKFRRTGGIIVQCFVPSINGSMDDAVTIAREVKNLFEGNTISTIRFMDASVREAPPVEGEFLQANAEITFQYDELK